MTALYWCQCTGNPVSDDFKSLSASPEIPTTSLRTLGPMAETFVILHEDYDAVIRFKVSFLKFYLL